MNISYPSNPLLLTTLDPPITQDSGATLHRYGYARLPRLQVSHPPFSTLIAVLDAVDHIMVVLAGQPDRNNWDDVHACMSVLMEQARNQVQGIAKSAGGSLSPFLQVFLMEGGKRYASLNPHRYALLTCTGPFKFSA